MKPRRKAEARERGALPKVAFLFSACFHTTIVLRPKGHFKTFWYKVFVLPF